MMDFSLFKPVKILTGVNCIEKNSDCFNLGKSCIIVTGKSSAIKSGALDDVIETLSTLNVEYLVYDKVKENPLLSCCYDGGQIANEFGAEFVVAIGGGSPMDAAKAIAAFATNPGIYPDDIFSRDDLNPSLPIIAIPTTAGTGSEVNTYSVLTLDKEDKKKTFKSQYSYPRYAILDPKYTYSLDKYYTMSTALDAFCHCIESYNSPKSDEFSEQAALYGAKIIWRAFDEIADSNEISYATREKLLYAACAGGIAIDVTGTGFPHPMGYNLTFNNNIPHGRACAVFIGKYIEYCLKSEKGADRMKKFCRFIDATVDELAVKIPRFSEVNIKLEDKTLNIFVEKIKTAGNFANSYYKINEEEIERIYKELFAK